MSKNTNLSFLTDYITADITNGRIGINNASPTVAFDVTGVAKFSSSGTFSGLVSGGNSSPSTSYNAGSWFTGDGLVAGNISSVGGIQINSSTTSTLSAIRFGDGDGVNNLYDQGFIIYKHTTDSMLFGANRSTAMTITSAGNVGIGTTSPLQTTTNRTVLTVNGTNQAIINLGYGGNLAAYLYTDNTNYSELYSYGQLNFVAAGSQPMTFTTTGGERMRITSGGNVGIGNTAFANTRLTITGISTTSSNYGLVVNNSSNANLFTVRDDGFVSANVVNANSFYSATGYSYPTVNVWTTFYTMASERGIYSVMIGLASESFAEWQAYGTIFCQSSTGAFSTLYNSSLVQMRTSGLNIQVLLAPGAGFTRELTFKVLRS